MSCGPCWEFDMETIEYKKPFGQTVFLVTMCTAMLFLFWFYYNFDREYLFTPRPILASLFLPLALIALTIGVKKITFDGASLRIVYGFGYSRTYPIQDIEKISFRDNEPGKPVAILVYLKNGEKFSRGLTGQNAHDFAQKMKPYFT